MTPPFSPSHIYSQMQDEELSQLKFFDVAKGWPVSTGPYGVSESNDQVAYFDLRPTWWAVETGFVEKYPDVWRFRVQPFTNDTLAAQQLINNEIDQSLDLRPLVVASLLAQASDHIEHLDRTNRPTVTPTGGRSPCSSAPMKPPFDNPKVRWAVAYALNQQQLVDVGWAAPAKFRTHAIP